MQEVYSQITALQPHVLSTEKGLTVGTFGECSKLLFKTFCCIPIRELEAGLVSAGSVEEGARSDLSACSFSDYVKHMLIHLPQQCYMGFEPHLFRQTQ